MANRLESLDESFSRRLKEEVEKQLTELGVSGEKASKAMEDIVGKMPSAPAWDRINTPRLGALREDNPPVIIKATQLTKEQKEDYANLMNGVRRENRPHPHAAFQQFVDQHPDEIERLSPDEFQLLALLFKTKGGESVISLFNQLKK